MAVTMRLRRTGRRNLPCYRLVVTDSRHPRDGRFIETLGHYDPTRDPARVVINQEKVLKWLGAGAGMSDTVRSILSREGILKRWKASKPAATKAAVGEVKEPKKVKKASSKPKAPGKTSKK